MESASVKAFALKRVRAYAALFLAITSHWWLKSVDLTITISAYSILNQLSLAI